MAADYFLDGTLVERCEVIKDLRALKDSSFVFGPQIRHTCSRASRTFRLVIQTVTHGLGSDDAVALFKTHVRALLEYSLTVWTSRPSSVSPESRLEVSWLPCWAALLGRTSWQTVGDLRSSESGVSKKGGQSLPAVQNNRRPYKPLRLAWEYPVLYPRPSQTAASALLVGTTSTDASLKRDIRDLGSNKQRSAANPHLPIIRTRSLGHVCYVILVSSYLLATVMYRVILRYIVLYCYTYCLSYIL